jgi:predicted RNA-binding protein with RPS1 domain
VEMEQIQIGNLIETTDESYTISVNGDIYYLPTKTYSKFDIDKEDKVQGFLIFDKRKQRNLFEPIHPIYKISETYEFDIIDFRNYNNKDFIIVKDKFDNEINVRAFKWQNKEILNEKQIVCKVIGFKYGKPILVNVDYRHPIYEVGKEYDFEFIGFEKRTNRDGNIFEIIKLKGADNCFHEVIPLPSQYGHKFKPKKIKCKVISITSYLSLSQASYKDYYYSKIEEILTDSKQIDFVYSLKSDVDTNPNIKELFKQYDTESSFWTITLCNKILPELIINKAKHFDFEKSIFLINILQNVENWILNKGLLDSFKKNETKEKIKNKSEFIIDKFDKMRKAFYYIINNELTYSNELSENISILIYYLRFNKVELIDKKSLVNILIQIIKNIPDDSTDFFDSINNLILSLDLIKKEIKNDKVELDFIIGKNNPFPFENNDKLFLFLELTFFQIYLLKKIGLIKKHNLYASEFCKYLTFTTINEFGKINYLKYAFFFNNNLNNQIDLKDEDLYKSSDIKYISKLILPQTLSYNRKIDDNDWNSIISSFKNNEIINIKLTKKERFGFNFVYNNVSGILPVTRIKSRSLKEYPEIDCEIVLSVTITDVFRDFNIILVKEINLNNSNHLLQNLLKSKIKVGDVIMARVKAIENYGVFLTSFVGDGLLHKSNITELYIDISLNLLFNKNEECYVCVLSKNKTNKIEFGLKQLNNTEYADTLKLVEKRLIHSDVYTDSVISDDILIPSRVSLEEDIKKRYFINGHIFEYFSNIQSKYDDKISYLNLSKIYYSAIKSERSHFLNIYINYFNILDTIEKTLDSKEISQISNFVTLASDLNQKLSKNKVSLERFPSVFRLLYFLDIISSFTQTKKENYDKLYDYIFNDKYKDFNIIQSISKIVLSNNLIFSEKEDDIFIFRNLQVIYYLLKQGIFNLDESVAEKRARLFKEKIKEIKESIKNEESEKVEFKSSLIKPVLSDYDIKRLRSIKKDPTKKNEIENIIGKKAKNRIIHSAMKTLVAFANSKGGTLFIGVDDDGNILGLNNDYDEIGSISRDEFRKKFDEFISNYIGDFFFGLISTEIEVIDNKDVLIVNVKAADEEVFLIRNDNKQPCSDFYIRRQSSSVKLNGKELINYYKNRFKTLPPTTNIVHLADSAKIEDDSNK